MNIPGRFIFPIHYLLFAACICLGEKITAHAFGGRPLPRAHAVEIGLIPADSTSCMIPFNKVGNLIVVQAKVDTMEGNFIIDTGAPDLVLNITYFRDYPVMSVANAGQNAISGSSVSLSKILAGQLSFGTLHYFNKEADLVSLGNIENARGIRILGLLGVELFKQCTMIIDFEKNIIFLHRIGRKEPADYPHELLRDTSAYRTFPVDLSENKIIATAVVAGKKLKFVVDCAAESNLLDSRLPNKILQQVTITRRVKLLGAGNKQVDALYGHLARLKIGTLEVVSLPVTVTNLENTCFSLNGCLDGVLGSEFLSLHQLGFNFVNHKMYIWK